jgi:hypothetical protein
MNGTSNSNIDDEKIQEYIHGGINKKIQENKSDD